MSGPMQRLLMGSGSQSVLHVIDGVEARRPSRPSAVPGSHLKGVRRWVDGYVARSAHAGKQDIRKMVEGVQGRLHLAGSRRRQLKISAFSEKLPSRSNLAS